MGPNLHRRVRISLLFGSEQIRVQEMIAISEEKRKFSQDSRAQPSTDHAELTAEVRTQNSPLLISSNLIFSSISFPSPRGRAKTYNSSPTPNSFLKNRERTIEI